MKTIAILFATTILLSTGAWAQAEDMKWHTEYQAALQEARESGKPLLVAFRCIP
jgi:hypothetical protein